MRISKEGETMRIVIELDAEDCREIRTTANRTGGNLTECLALLLMDKAEQERQQEQTNEAVPC